MSHFWIAAIVWGIDLIALLAAVMYLTRDPQLDTRNAGDDMDPIG